MNKKKHVVFSLNNQKQFYGEFHENSKIRLIKAYFRDISHIDEFNFLYNGEYIQDDEISLRDVINYSSKINIVLNVEELKFNEMEQEKKANTNKIITVEKNNEELINQLNLSKKEIDNLRNVIEELNINNCTLQKNIDILQKQNFQLQKEKIDLEKQSEDYIKEIYELKTAKSSLEESINKSSFVKQTYNKSRGSSVGNSLNETSNKTANNINIINSNSNVSPSTINKRASALKSKNAASSQSHYTFRSSLKNSNLQYKGQIVNNSDSASNLNKKSDLDNSNSFNIISKEKVIPNEKLTNDYNEKKLQITDVLSKPFKLLKKKSGNSNTNFEWGHIFSYLSKEDLLNFSSTSIQNYKISMNFLYEIMTEKKNRMEEFIKLTHDYYKSILLEKRFELSLSTTSAVKILNRPSSIDVYSKDLNYFSNPLILMCYQLLFQISKIVENAIDLDITNVLELIRTLILSKLNTGFGLGDYIKSLASKACFDDDNIEKLRIILKKYDMKKIDLALMGKLCKTTGMIAFFIKDALSYCGLDVEKEKNIVKRRTRSGSMIKLLSDVDICNIEKEKLVKNIPHLENLVKKY